jgi:hypothetical protein
VKSKIGNLLLLQNRQCRVITCTVVACVMVIARIATSGSAHAVADQRETRLREEAERLWSQIIAATKKYTREFDEDPKEAWKDVCRDARAAFNAMTQNPERKAMLAFFVEQFGKHGPRADMAWCLVQVEAGLMPASGRCLDNDVPAARDHRAVQLMMAELKVRHFLAHPKLLARYYDVLAWERIWFKDWILNNHIRLTREHRQKAEQTGHQGASGGELTIEIIGGGPNPTTYMFPSRLQESLATVSAGVV